MQRMDRSRQKFLRPLRYLLGTTSILFTVSLIINANDVNDYISIVGLCSLSIALFASKRISRFFGSIFALFMIWLALISFFKEVFNYTSFWNFIYNGLFIPVFIIIISTLYIWMNKFGLIPNVFENRRISFDNEFIYIDDDNIVTKINWYEIEKITFEANILISHLICLDSRKGRSYIATDNLGCSELWEELIKRNLFSKELADKAINSTSGEFVLLADEN